MSTSEASPPLASRAVAAEAPLFIVLNLASGAYDATAVRGTIEQALTAAGRVFSLHDISQPGQLAEIARDVVVQARARGGVVVAAGGDGTINTVAQATLGSGCPFGVLPLGTFNYFSRTHGIPSNLEEACQILLGDRAYEVQVGLVNDHVFLVNASLGLYPKLLEDREQAEKQLGRSRWVSMGAALATLFGPRRKLWLEIGSSEGTRTIFTPTLFIGNNRLQLERLGLADSAVIERHRLVAVVLRPVGSLAMLGLVVRALLGRLGNAERVLSFDFERITVRSRLGQRRFKVATDGEVTIMKAPLSFRVAPLPLLLLRPAGPVEDPG